MAVRKIETFPPVTMAHIRGHGCRDLLIYCNSGVPLDAQHIELVFDVTEYEMRPRHVMIVLTHIRNDR
jgi:hypothetical protein